ncbi:transcriptional regulator FtsR [Virgisporangium aurantiacum]|uniref:transcriptional regulator FtsR n=1 Tax=Virgisporangium aurantiacum TaxID=175570 RepID=UPI00194F2E0D|nr:MerR family transcriptional regulator [Virgisporangium aurantiacum]
MSIGEVLNQLRGDFPDVSISKLRFLESEGLVEPSRTPSGYRKYTRADVARLRYVLAAQRDHYLPLRVIREQLAAIDRGETLAGTPVLVAVPPASTESPAAVPAAADERVDRADLLARTGVSEEILVDLEKHGIVAPEDGGLYAPDAVEVLTVAGALSEYGVTARHLRAYRVAADREVGLFTQLIAPLARGTGPAARDRAAETVRELSGLTGRLHAALVRVGLGQTLR